MTETKRLKIGIFGGSFNPPTTAHAALSAYAHEKLGLDQLWWLVAPHNPFKDKADLAPFSDRMVMAHNIAAHHQPWLVASDLEHQFGTQQTSDTLEKLLHRFPQHDFVWLMGTDNLAHFHLWDHWKNITKAVPVCVFSRPTKLEDALNAPAAQEMGAPKPIAPGQLQSGCWYLLSNPHMDVAATNIRKAIAAGEEPDHIEAETLGYIRQHGLYQKS